MKYLKTFICLFIVTNLSGQTFTNYTTADGLVDNNVSCGTFEGNGVMWFGTQNGISKFDGTNWTNITTTTDTALVSNTITAIKSMANGDLWVGTDFGVCKYSNSTWQCFTSADGLGDDRIKYIEQSLDGRIWIGEYDGLSIYDGTNWTSYNMSDGLPFGGIQSIKFDNNSEAWMGSGFGGLIHYDGTNFTVYNTTDGLLNNRVNGIAIDSQNNKWVGNSAGVSVFNNQNIFQNNYTQMYLLPPPDTLNPVMDLAFDSRNLLWVGIYIDYLLNGGVAMYNGFSWVDFNMNDGLIGPVITDLIIDDQDQVWVTTSSGISKITNVQYTSVPDDNFEAYLEANGMGDGISNNNSVTTANINTITSLNVSNQAISDLTGIEAFTALTNLECSSNQLTGLDLSQNTLLTALDCPSNQLTLLDLSSNTALTYLFCDNNQLTCLNVKNGNNNTLLVESNLNPNLSCIEVDNPAWSNANWTIIDPNVTFSTNCNYPLGCFNINPNSVQEIINTISLYPNPTSENITISIENFNGNIQTEVYDLIGNRLQATNETTISLQDYARGIYLFKVAYGDKLQEVKVIKQ